MARLEVSEQAFEARKGGQMNDERKEWKIQDGEERRKQRGSLT